MVSEDHIADESDHKSQNAGHDQKHRQNRQRKMFDPLEPLKKNIDAGEKPGETENNSKNTEMEQGVVHFSVTVDSSDDLVPVTQWIEFCGGSGAFFVICRDDFKSEIMVNDCGADLRFDLKSGLGKIHFLNRISGEPTIS